ncbi:decapping and exoribonuclease protein Rai1-like isoform X1 [Musca autumnalis]|uniref:decapping and exoribonuclease protein Rai1-like isoform X1 n=1 Tax=Musca autumnalis TaxID=221902 RepID=UPI003CF7D025
MANSNWRERFLMDISRRDILYFQFDSKYILEPPQLLGLYEYNYEHFEAAKYLKYFKEPQSMHYPFDLNKGYSATRYTLPCKLASRLHLPLKYDMTINKDQTTKSSTTPIYTSRRVVTKLMEFCYSKDDFYIWITRFNGSFYISGELSCLLDENPKNMHHQRLEKYLFADSPDNEPNTEEPIDMNIALSALHRANVGKFSLIYAGEVQGIISDKKLENLTDMDLLNQCRFVFTKQMWDTAKKEHYFLRYWIQSRLSNIEDLYVAYKNTHGIVEKPIEHHNVSDIPKLFSWKPEVCYGFLHKFLENVENLMRDVNSLDTVYEFKFNAKNKTTTYEVYKGREDKMFIPKYYADFVSK